MKTEKIKLHGRFGTYKGVVWGRGNEQKVLALHGWLDNCLSFNFLAPIIAQQGYEVVAIDFPGHGRSDHRAKGHFNHFVDYVLDIQEVLKQLKWSQTILLGHSMGAAMAQMYSVSCPETIKKLILIENLGAVPPYQPGTAAENLREALAQWNNHSLKHKNHYPTVEKALQARQKATPIEAEFLKPMVERGLKKTKKGYRWRTDKRLRLRSLFRISEQMTQDFLASKKPETLVILAQPTSYAMSYPSANERLKALKPEKMVHLAGHHHLHMDQADSVAKPILDFLKNPAN